MDVHFPIVVSGTFTNHEPVQFAGHQRFGQRFFSVLPYKSIATYGAEQESITHHHTNLKYITGSSKFRPRGSRHVCYWEHIIPKIGTFFWPIRHSRSSIKPHEAMAMLTTQSRSCEDWFAVIASPTWRVVTPLFIPHVNIHTSVRGKELLNVRRKLTN